ncbi:CDP-diacylglycerol--glycerol-3-phosphate 3-phosphatidyltransferase [Actinomycetota bacterium]|nr:CDP-diacylglycerol--glycerol-3-phosphate 3-phosphatidyltransferase [Actinomycetota bacterium]
MNVANWITTARIIVVVPFVVLVYFLKNSEVQNPTSNWMSWILVLGFIIIAASDALDGHLARSRNEVTDLGKFLDPIADKVLVLGTLFVLNIVNVLPLWITIVITARELAITLLRLWIKKYKHTVIAASIFGKLKTVSQCLLIGFYLAPLAFLPVFFTYLAQAILYIALLLTILSAIEYFYKTLVDKK